MRIFRKTVFGKILCTKGNYFSIFYPQKGNLFFFFFFPSFALNKFIFFFSPCFFFLSFFGHSSLFCRIKKKEAIVLENNCFFLKNYISFFMMNFEKLVLRDTPQEQTYNLKRYPTPQIVSIY